VTIETWVAFAAASAVLLVIPGPTILLVISYALGRGMRTAMPVAVGVALGDFTAMTLSMLGVGALLAASSLLFTVLVHQMRGDATRAEAVHGELAILCRQRGIAQELLWSEPARGWISFKSRRVDLSAGSNRSTIRSITKALVE